MMGFIDTMRTYLGLAYSTLRGTGEAWESHLARAAVLIAAAGAVLAILTIIGGLIHHA